MAPQGSLGSTVGHNANSQEINGAETNTMDAWHKEKAERSDGVACCCLASQADGIACCDSRLRQASLHRPGRDQQAPWVTGWLGTSGGPVPQVATTLRFADRVGGWKARWAIGRMGYRVEPGLYAVGDPGPHSHVLVTANYKMTFDRLRQELSGLDLWVMVLDTEGINVWCAAGKGTFGAEEIIRRMEATQLARLVSHQTLILPQLSAPGVAAHEVSHATGFRVVYGPVRARDIPSFLAAGLKAPPEMRRVTFRLWDRLVLVPMELMAGLKYSLGVILALLLLAGFGHWGYSLERAWALGWRAALLSLAGFLGGAALTPALLPWLPGRRFSLKGAWMGLALAVGYLGLRWPEMTDLGPQCDAVAWLFLLPTVSAFFAMNFTGASTYTSLSGVRREMRVAVPTQVAGVLLGLGFWLAGHFV